MATRILTPEQMATRILTPEQKAKKAAAAKASYHAKKLAAQQEIPTVDILTKKPVSNSKPAKVKPVAVKSKLEVGEHISFITRRGNNISGKIHAIVTHKASGKKYVQVLRDGKIFVKQLEKL